MTESWKAELRRLCLILALSTLLGLAFGHVLIGVVVALIGYLAWTFWHLRQLDHWLQSGGRREPPESHGFWGSVFDSVYRIRLREQRERSRLEAAIEHLQQSFESLNDAVVMLDAQGQIEWCNPAAESLLGLRYPADRGGRLLNLIRTPSFVRYFEAEAYHEPIEMVSPVSNRRHLAIQITLFGRRNRILFARDITRFRQLETMRKDFVANVSHDLKTPLTVISGYLETLRGSPLSDEPRWARVFEQMQQESQRMGILLQDLLLLSRLENVPSRQPAAVDVSALLHEVLTTVRAANPEREYHLECEDSLCLLGDRDELHSAFMNLLSNAAKYTGTGGRITLECRSGPTGGLSVAVRDNGIGIDPVHIPRLTERFYRVDSSRSRETGGTGLGLAIVKHVLLRHDARLAIESRPGEGSTFTCLFPAERVNALQQVS